VSNYVTRHSVWVAEEATLWVEGTKGHLWLGLTADDQSAQTLYAITLNDLGRVSDALAAIVAQLEREEAL
jgi:hypothetical protein